VAIAPNGGEILVGTNEGELVVFDTRTFARKLGVDMAKYKKRSNAVDGRMGRKATPGNNSREHWISCISFSPSGHAVAVGTFGCVVVLLDVTTGYSVRAVLDRSNTPITAIDWSADGTVLAVNDRSLDLLFYHVDEQNLRTAAAITNASSVRDVVWHTHTCALSWPTSGVTQPHHQGQFVNSCDSNPSRTLVATGDDSGCVNLMRFPALQGVHAHKYPGHSAHVTCTRFAPNERFLVSTGGHDLAIMQWAIV
jgi:WD40 repeat protein